MHIRRCVFLLLRDKYKTDLVNGTKDSSTNEKVSNITHIYIYELNITKHILFLLLIIYHISGQHLNVIHQSFL